MTDKKKGTKKPEEVEKTTAIPAEPMQETPAAAEEQPKTVTPPSLKRSTTSSSNRPIISRAGSVSALISRITANAWNVTRSRCARTSPAR
jgi:hypothetical protein